MISNNVKTGKYDWLLIALYLILVFFGWLNIFSAIYADEHDFIFDITQKYGMQFIWIITSLIIAFLILFVIPQRVYNVLPPLLYFVVLLLLFVVIFLGKEVNGSKSWFVLGPISFQPAEVSKISTSLFLAYIMSKYNFKLSKTRDWGSVALIILIPILLIIMEKETGSALVYLGFIFMLFREGLSGLILVLGFVSILFFVVTLKFSPTTALAILTLAGGIIEGIITRRLILKILPTILLSVLIFYLPELQAMDFLKWSNVLKPEYWAIILIVPFFLYMLFRSLKKRVPYFGAFISICTISIMLIFSVDFIFDNILQPHQRARIENLLGIQEDLRGVGYNVHQSKIAIGSGGVIGKGYLQGTQTKFNFVPEQSTDFIFCTVGEEWGFVGSTIIIILYITLICRIIIDSDRQRDAFTRIYGYCVASCFFMHVFINISMTIGLAPVIGIPLPFLSYGGSSLWTFTILLFIFIKLQQQRED